jgi:hypothetical protein
MVGRLHVAVVGQTIRGDATVFKKYSHKPAQLDCG